MAYKTELKIADIVKDIQNNKYVMPAIQREFVWDSERIENLFDSLMQGYPIGAFLFWEVTKDRLRDYDFYEFLKKYHERDYRHNLRADLKGSDGVTAVLDGQQRLTSLYIGLKGTYASKIPNKRKNNNDSYPEKRLYLNLVGCNNDDNNTNKYEFKFLKPLKYNENNEIIPDKDCALNTKESYWFEVGQILDMNLQTCNKYVIKHIERSKEIQYTEDQSDFAIDTLVRLCEVIHTEGHITYYKETTDDLDKILNIFIRVNNGGLVLSYSDLLLSVASAQWEKFDARDEITSFVDEINNIGDGFNINKDFVLKAALVLSDSADIAFKVKNFKKDKTRIIENNWETIKKAIRLATNLVQSFGFSKNNFKTYNALIPIAYYLKTIGIPDNFVNTKYEDNNRKTIKKWLTHSILKKAFSGQPDNVIKPIREIIQKIKEDKNKVFPFDKIVERFKGTNKTIIFSEDDIDNFVSNLEYGKPEALNVLMLLYSNLDYRNHFHIDHIYPKSKFTKTYLSGKGVSENKISDYQKAANSIANLQLLDGTTNTEKNDKDFDIWFKETNKTEIEQRDYRTKHYLPELEYSYQNFLNFIEERKKELKKALEKLLDIKTEKGLE